MKKGQAWGIDLTVGVVIFLIGILSIYLYTTNFSGGAEEFNDLAQEGASVADSLMSEGSPTDWSAGNVVRIGLLSGGRIDSAKLDAFQNLAENNYELTRKLFRIKGDYFVYFDGDEGSGSGGDYSSASNLIKTTRVVVYENKITTLNVYVWN